MVAATSSGGRTAIVASGVPADSCGLVDGAGEAAQPGDERRVAERRAGDLGAAEVAGDGVGERRQGDRLSLHGAERRAHRVPAPPHRRARSTDRRRARRGSATAARRRRRPSSTSDRPPVGRGDAQLRRGEHLGGAASGVEPAAARQLVDHRRERVDRQPHRCVGVVGQRGEAVERDAGRLDDARRGSGRPRRWRGTPRRSSVVHTISPAAAPTAPTSSAVASASSSLPSMTLRRSRSAPATSTTRRATAPMRLPVTIAAHWRRSRQPGSSRTAWWRPSSSSTRSSTSWAKRSVSLAPMLTSAARATSSSRRDCVSRRWSAVLGGHAASAGRRSPAGPRSEAIAAVEVLGRRGRRLLAQRVQPRSQAGRVERGARRRRSGRRAWRPPSPRASPSSRRSAMSCSRSRSGPGGVDADGLGEPARRALAGLHELPPRLADGERIDGRRLGAAAGTASSDGAGVDDDADGDGAEDRHADDAGDDAGGGAEQDPPREDRLGRRRRPEPVAEAPSGEG